MSLVTTNSSLIFMAAYLSYFAMLLLMMFGPANRHNANDNTSGVITLLEIMSTLPENLRDKVCFVLFDLEEAGLIGSSSYRKTHKAATDRQIVLKLSLVEDMINTTEKKQIQLHCKGFAYCPSDHKHFPYGVGIMAFHKVPVVGLYCSRIHTWRDKVLEDENINILRNAIVEMIAAAEK